LADITALFEWLVDGAPGAASAAAVVERIGEDLNAAGVAVGRIAAFVTTLHPQVAGRGFRWNVGRPCEVGELSHAMQHAPMFLLSPVAKVMREGVPVRCRLKAPGGDGGFAIAAELAAEGFTDYVVLPMAFRSGEIHAITFATRAPAGFSDDGLAAIARVVRPLARVAEILALRRTAVNLLSTYCGRDAGERILAGRVVRGDVETVRAVIWFSDLRGFTAMSAGMAPAEVIATLNEVFECQVPAILRHGGEVLKFIGDGMLAIFPTAAGETAAVTAAITAAGEALAAVAGHGSLTIGIALHVGEIAYGNIGGASRLDFTAIGAAVNLAARLEGLTARVGRALVVSEEVAMAAGVPMMEVGAFELKGVPGMARVFGVA
jgi:adenylate cyclase